MEGRYGSVEFGFAKIPDSRVVVASMPRIWGRDGNPNAVEALAVNEPVLEA